MDNDLVLNAATATLLIAIFCVLIQASKAHRANERQRGHGR